jgi:hypothetical protein
VDNFDIAVRFIRNEFAKGQAGSSCNWNGGGNLADFLAALNEGNKQAINNAGGGNDAFEQGGSNVEGSVEVTEVANVTYNATTGCPDTNSEFLIEINANTDVPGLVVGDYPGGAYPSAQFILE